MLHIVLTRIRQESANNWDCNTMKDLLLPNTVNQKDEKLYTAGLDDTAILHINIKLPKYRKNKLNTAIPLIPMSPSFRFRFGEQTSTLLLTVMEMRLELRTLFSMIQPSLLPYVNHAVLRLTRIFQA